MTVLSWSLEQHIRLGSKTVVTSYPLCRGNHPIHGTILKPVNTFFSMRLLNLRNAASLEVDHGFSSTSLIYPWKLHSWMLPMGGYGSLHTRRKSAAQLMHA